MRVLRIPRGVPLGYAAALLAFAVDGLYLALIARQDTGWTSRIAFVAGSLAAAGTVCATAELCAGFAAGVGAAWAAATLWIWAVLAGASIGLLLAPAGVLATVALTRRAHGALAVAVGIAAALLVGAAGLAWTPA